MSIANRGFASMDREKRREIASRGGRTAHRVGKAHQWTREEASAAARKARDNSRQRAKEAAATDAAGSAPDPADDTGRAIAADEMRSR